MRFRHHDVPERASVRQTNDAAMGTVEAAVFRESLPGEESFPSGVAVGDPFEPPAQVENVAASAGLRTILIEWDRLDGFQTVDGAGGYEVQLDTVNTFDASPRVQRTSATMASFTDLTPATEYFVRVRGVQGADNVGEWSLTTSAITALADTGDIQASAITADKIAANAVNAAKLAAITMEVGKYFQSDNYDGTDVDTGDATQGFRLEAEGDAEFRNVRLRGDIEATAFRAVPGTFEGFTTSTFETDDEGWTGLAGGTVARSTLEARSGTYSLKVDGSSSGDGARSAAFTPTPGDFLRASIWGKEGSGVQTLSYRFRWESDLAGTLLSYSDTASGSIDTTSWSQVGEQQAFEVPVGAVVGYLEVIGGGEVQTFYLDDVDVLKAPLLAGAFMSSENETSVRILEDDTIRFKSALSLADTRIKADGHAGSYGDLYLYSGAPSGEAEASILLRSGFGSDDARIALDAAEVYHESTGFGKRVWPAFYAEGVGSILINSGISAPMDSFGSTSDPDSMINGSTGEFAAPADGLYTFEAWTEEDGMSGARFLIGYQFNLGTNRWMQTTYPDDNNPVRMSFSITKPMTAGDTFRGILFQTSGIQHAIPYEVRLISHAPADPSLV